MPYPEIQTVRLPEFWQNAGTKRFSLVILRLFLHRYHLKETRINILDDLADCITFSGRSPAFKHNKNRYFFSLIKSCCRASFSFTASSRALISPSDGFSDFSHSFSIKTPPYAFSYHTTAADFHPLLCKFFCFHFSLAKMQFRCIVSYI